MRENKTEKVASLIEDMDEIKHMLINFKQTGYLDRNKAISKIVEVRTTNESVLAAYAIEQAGRISTTLDCVSNAQLANELAKQWELLQNELLQISLGGQS